MSPAAEMIKCALPELDELECEFAELVLWYDGFKDSNRLSILPYFSEDCEVIRQKRERARAGKDFETADFLRDVLLQCGIPVRDTSLATPVKQA